MFFKGIEKYSNKKLKALSLIFNGLYLIAFLIIPIIIICDNYCIFKKATANSIRITGIGLIFFVLLGLFCYIKLKKLIAKFPQETLNQQRFKFTIEMIFNLLPLLLILIVLTITQDNLLMAFKTFRNCSYSIILSILIDGLCVKYLDAEIGLRKEARHLKSVKSREDIV